MAWIKVVNEGGLKGGACIYTANVEKLFAFNWGKSRKY